MRENVRDADQVEARARAGIEKIKPEVWSRIKVKAAEELHAWGLALRLLREIELEITQEEAGKRTGHKQSVVSRWETAVDSPSRNNVRDYVRDLGCTMETFGRYHALALVMIYGCEDDLEMELAFTRRVLNLGEKGEEISSSLGIPPAWLEGTLGVYRCFAQVMREMRKIERRIKAQHDDQLNLR